MGAVSSTKLLGFAPVQQPTTDQSSVQIHLPGPTTSSTTVTDHEPTATTDHNTTGNITHYNPITHSSGSCNNPSYNPSCNDATTSSASASSSFTPCTYHTRPYTTLIALNGSFDIPMPSGKKPRRSSSMDVNVDVDVGVSD